MAKPASLFHLADQRRLIDLTQWVLTLVQEMQAMATQIEVTQLPRDNDLEDHADVVRGA